MSTTPTRTAPSEKESRQVAEASRETEWKAPSFLKELFLGDFRLDLIYPYQEAPERPEFTAFFNELRRFLREEVDSAEIDRSGEYPPAVIDALRKMGAFGMKIPREYGGLGLTQVEYDKIMRLLGSKDGNLTALLSAHQSIGVPQPLKMFGTPEQKKKYLPRCAAGAISAFALTEPDVGSDPAALQTTCELTPEGDAYILNGSKLWCTNGTFAELLVVMARNPKNQKISAFVVETSWEGVQVEQRCRFMGLRALGNAVITLTRVRVPKENLVGGEGRGLKIALVTLNTGRLSLPAGATGGAKVCMEICRRWAGSRVQWGLPVGKHEAIAHKLADMAATTFAMESVSGLADRLSDVGSYDIRLEAAAAKEFCSVQGWNLVDDTMQIRGGRGYETEQSLGNRGEEALPVERNMRDFRINRIFEGSSEIMHLFMAREAVDVHLGVAGAVIDDAKSPQEKMKALPQIARFYAEWYPKKWLGWSGWPKYNEFGSLACHLRFAESNTRALARSIFHGMLVFQAKLQRKQAFLFRAVDIGLYLFAMSACVTRARHMKEAGHPDAHAATELADLFCRNASRQVTRLFQDMWHNDDDFKYRVGKNVLERKYTFLENGTAGLDLIYERARASAPVQPPVEATSEEPSAQPAQSAEKKPRAAVEATPAKAPKANGKPKE